MGKIRVLVVEDSLTVRKRLCEVLESDPDFEVVAEARDGQEGVELCARLRPDVITMDMMLPGMTGLAATEHIMAHAPTPILIVSSSVNRGELFKTYDALAAGAVDILEKPPGDDSNHEWERQFLSTLKIVSRIRVITHPRARLGELGRARPSTPAAPPALPTAMPRFPRTSQVIAVGASTGGPGAIVEVLRAFPLDYPTPILVVLHIGEPFAAAFTDWLGGQIRRQVTYAADGERLGFGRVIMAPPDRHLVLRDGYLRLTRDPERHGCRPSIDVLLESVAQSCGANAAACLLTGMGRDGAAGLLAVRRAGGMTIAQDEATSVVYGMPREAALLGAAEAILPLSEIGPALAALPHGVARASLP